ncbi:DUF5999 family protein [Streptomyces sp. KMM 9044]|uniref:DUF5999 family protein n=1 Tax=Streptomyces sp. KMM 9044 TaxID=2744474 RepID=UPI002151900E|nr:DUF5999 family protein [Streptomyces sp. KMM 9044]WAX77397.1 DUF5999 family protein [Streptomyces sp. KMM 9044]
MPRPPGQVPHGVAAHPEQGRSLMRDGATVFDDPGEPLPGSRAIAPHRPPAGRPTVAA